MVKKIGDLPGDAGDEVEEKPTNVIPIYKGKKKPVKQPPLEFKEDNRAMVYVEDDGLVVYRGSSLGFCTKALYLSRMGVTPVAHPEWLLEKFAEGIAAEPIIIQSLEEYHGVVVDHRQEECELVVKDGVVIRFHPDGVMLQSGIKTVVEVKALAKSTYQSFVRQGWDAFPYYAWQLSVMMHYYQLPGMMVFGIKGADGVFNGEIEVANYTEPPISLGKIKARIKSIERMAENAEQPVCSYAQFPCGFYQHHDETDVVHVKRESAMLEGDEAKNLTIASYAKYRDIENEAKASKKQIASTLLLMMEGEGFTKGEGKIVTDDWTVTDVVSEKPTLTWDEEKMKTDGIDPEEYKILGSYEVRYPLVKARKKKGD